MAEKKRRFPLPRLSRGWRTVRNLAAAAVCLYALWAWAGYPLPTAEMEFRRLERQNMIAPSEIQGVFRGSYQRQAVYGVLEDKVVLGYSYGLMRCWPRSGDGATLFPASVDNFLREMLLAAADVPEGTASARLDMTVSSWLAYPESGGTRYSAVEGGDPRDDSLSWKLWERDYQAEGELLKGGGVLFRVPRKDPEGAVPVERELFDMLNRESAYLDTPAYARGVNCRAQAVFYGEDGGELGRAVLATPEDAG